MIVARDHLITHSGLMRNFWNKIWAVLSTEGLTVTSTLLFGNPEEGAIA